MRRWWRFPKKKPGFTIIEALLTITVLAILSVGVSALYMQALRMYQRGSREATSRDKSALALERMMPDLREAYNVDYPGPSVIVFTLPARNAEGRYYVDPDTRAPAVGKQVAYFQGNASGNYDDQGHFIWRAERASVSAPWTNKQLVMDDVEDLSFTYAPSVDMPELVQVAVTVGQGTHPGYFNRTEVAEVMIRNH
ncbi:MAG: PulJ/GspJ family protein [Candidatus Zipacnadales bacterium]